MMAEQPPIDTQQDILFLLTGIWDDSDGGPWLCDECCLVEGALLLNPHWTNMIRIVRIEYARPRQEIVVLLDDAHQNAPTLILGPDSEAHEAVDDVAGRRIITDPEAICRQLAASYGGARPK